MGFFYQLKLLLWKNYVLRKRQPFWLIVELVWPLLLFIILALVKMRPINQAIHECHYDGKAMPSAGAIPFLQGIICSSNNTCYRRDREDEMAGQVTNFNQSQINMLLGDIETLLANNSDVNELLKIVEDFETLNKILDKARNGSLQGGQLSVDSLFTNPAKVRAELMSSNASLTEEEVNVLFNSTLNIPQLLKDSNIPLSPEDFLSRNPLNPTNALTQLSELLTLVGGLTFLPTSETVLRGILCNETLLQRYVTYSDSQVGLNATRRLCSLNSLTWVDVVRQQFDQAKLQAQVLQWVELNAGKAIQLSEETSVAARNLFSDLAALSSMSTVSNNILKDLRGPAADLDSGNTFGSVAKLFCGRSDGFFGKVGQQQMAYRRVTNGTKGNNGTVVDIGCKNSTLGTEYMGQQSMTAIGTPCQPWTSQSPHTHSFTGNSLPDGSLKAAENYCRNPDNEDSGPWCFTMDPDIRFDFCHVPRCSANHSNEETKGGNSDGAYCYFPFYFNGTMHDKCIYSRRGAWCATTANFTRDRKWGRCKTTCEKLFEPLRESKEGKLFWKQLKPMLQGRIPYAPHNPVTERIMRQANVSFDGLGRLKNLAQDWLNYSSTFVQYMNTSENIQLIRDFIKRALRGTNQNATGYRQLAVWDKWLYNGPKENSSYDWRDSVRYMNEFSNLIVDNLNCFELNKFEPMSSVRQLEKRSIEYIESGMFWAAIQFDNMDENTTEMPTHIKYRLRMDASKVDGTTKIYDSYWRPGGRARAGIDTKYITFGFAYLQDMIEHGIIREQTGNEDPGVFLQQFPYPCYINDRYANLLSRAIPLFMVLAWIFTVAFTVKNIVREKERRLKEVMKMMGLTSLVHYVGWFVTILITMILSIIMLTMIIKLGGVFEHSDGFIIFLFLLCFAVCTIPQCFFFSTLFSRANLAAVCSPIFYFVLYLPYTMFIQWEEYMSTGQKFAGCLLSTVSFGFGCSYIARYEEQAIGIQWDNIDSSPMPGDGFSLLRCMILMLFDGLVFCILTWYIESVFPGTYGLPQPWYFPFKKSYWCGNAPVDDDGVTFDMSAYDAQQEEQGFEKDPVGLRLGVSIQNLKKSYKKGQLAVDGLSCRFFEGQITSFLGHNGAGKTTTMSILTGLFPPTSGTAFIYDKDIRHDMDKIRNSLGMCPQHNVLFDQLTVEEHMWFYARLKGMRPEDVMTELDQMIEDVGLPHKRHELSKSLSGGMKRKLSVAIAFGGGSKTVILDEPTAGVDPAARRQIWELILNYKRDRTILLTTHHMDEADVLGDRIAIIAKGKLRCCGSSLFLKSHYGNGYYLTIVKSEDSRPSTGQSHTLTIPKINEDDEGYTTKSERSDSEPPSKSSTPPPIAEDRITSTIQRFLPDARLVEDVGQEMCYQLPEEGAKSGAFVKLFTYLDLNLESLQISGYGISDTTLEEVFLTVADEAGTISDEQVDALTDNGRFPRPVTRLSFRSKLKMAFQKKKENWNVMEEDAVSVTPSEAIQQASADTYGPGSPEVTGCQLLLRQLRALFVKRFHHVRRSKKGFVCEVLLPAAFICLAMVVATIQPSDYNQPPLELQPWMYTPKADVSDPHLTVFYSNDSPEKELSIKLEKMLLDGLYGTRCMNDSVYAIPDLPCKPVENSYDQTRWTKAMPMYMARNQTKRCSCESGQQVCPKGAAGPEAPTKLVKTTDYVMNMTGRNISDWIVKTRLDYIKMRYGGFSFGESNPIAEVNRTQISAIFDRLAKAVNNGNPSSAVGVSDAARLLESLISQRDVKVWYNNKGWTAGVSYMNAVNNLLLRSLLPPGKDPRMYGITAVNHPMNLTKAQLTDKTLNSAWINVILSICVIFAMAVIPASFTMYLIEDRVSTSKHLQFVSGVNPLVYWVSTYMWDVMNYTVTALVCYTLFFIFNAEAFIIPEHAPCMVLLLFLYGWAIIPMMYPFSYVFKVPSTAFVALACLNIMLGVVSTIATYILDLFPDEELKAINVVLKEVFLMLPHYCLGRGLVDMAYNYLNYQVSSVYFESTVLDPFKWKEVGKNLFCLAVEGCAFFVLVILIQYKFFVPQSCLQKGLFKMHTPPIGEEDEDVAMERDRVNSGRANRDMMVLKNLKKIYRTNRGKRLVAVDGLCVGVPKGQCFGLLGINGAGKTTTFKMLTGDTSVTSGDATVSGYSVLTHMTKVHQKMGYCPQFDALDSLLSGREHLEFYSRLRGVPEKDVSRVAEWCLRKMNLTEHADKQSCQYSGGNKRKLSTAIALIGNPPVIFLDEPTTGMDPKARRFLWNRINSITREGRSVILTTHSMEECEALCNRLGIMVNGKFKCLGSIQHLKNRFGDGYTLIVKVSGTRPELQPLKEYIAETFPQSVIKEEHHNMIQYQLGSHVGLAHVFSVLESIRLEFSIEDYSVSQTTLDQVFINLANQQVDAEEFEFDDSPLPLSVVSDRLNNCDGEVSQSGSTVDLLDYRYNCDTPTFINLEGLSSRSLTPVEA